MHAMLWSICMVVTCVSNQLVLFSAMMKNSCSKNPCSGLSWMRENSTKQIAWPRRNQYGFIYFTEGNSQAQHSYIMYKELLF